MNVLTSVAVLVLQRVPLLNRIPAVRDAHTIEAAFAGLNKFVQRLENVHTHQREAAVTNRKVAEAALQAAIEAEAVADRAKRVASNIGELLA